MDSKERPKRAREREIRWAVGGVIGGSIAGFVAGFLVCFLVTATLPPRAAEPPASVQATTAPAGPSVAPIQITNVPLQDLVNPGSSPSDASTQRVDGAGKKL
ncbi:MAG: hypothetical protein WCK27_03405 [Verrucomicrobiota bacterium]